MSPASQAEPTTSPWSLIAAAPLIEPPSVPRSATGDDPAVAVPTKAASATSGRCRPIQLRRIIRPLLSRGHVCCRLERPKRRTPLLGDPKKRQVRCQVLELADARR